MIEDAAAVDGKIAILYVDLDNFKLQAIAKRLTGCIRSSLSESTDAHGPLGIARLGGDEFVAAIEGVEDEAVLASVVGHRVGGHWRGPGTYTIGRARRSRSTEPRLHSDADSGRRLAGECGNL